MSGIIDLLDAAGQGDRNAAGQLLPLVYAELHRLATARLAQEPPGPTLTATVLVHEAYLRIVGGGDPGWNSRRHFFGAAARAMRRILVERARSKKRLRHGGGLARVPFDQVEEAAPQPDDDLLALDEALGRLEREEPRAAEVVHLRYFAGLTIEEAARALGVSVGTANRDWVYARALLHRWLRAPDQGGR
jgi:RNA polymerase sigma factor (TIGR02999 family)